MMITFVQYTVAKVTFSSRVFTSSCLVYDTYTSLIDNFYSFEYWAVYAYMCLWVSVWHKYRESRGLPFRSPSLHGKCLYLLSYIVCLKLIGL